MSHPKEEEVEGHCWWMTAGNQEQPGRRTDGGAPGRGKNLLVVLAARDRAVVFGGQDTLSCQDVLGGQDTLS